MRVPVRRTVLVIPLEEQEGDDTQTPPRLMLVMPVEPKGSVSEIYPSNAKDEASGIYEKKGPGFPVRSTKVPETTMKDASVTYKQSVSHKTTDLDIKTNDFKDLLTKTYNAKRPDQPLKLAYKNKSFETQGEVAARIFMRQSPVIENGGLREGGNRMYVTTLGHENADLKPATVNLVHDKSTDLDCSPVSNENLRLFCPAQGPVYRRARVKPRLTETGGQDFLQRCNMLPRKQWELTA